MSDRIVQEMKQIAEILGKIHTVLQRPETPVRFSGSLMNHTDCNVVVPVDAPYCVEPSLRLPSLFSRTVVRKVAGVFQCDETGPRRPELPALVGNLSQVANDLVHEGPTSVERVGVIREGARPGSMLVPTGIHPRWLEGR